jgi:tetratricopeptide (TPR) repeat protein
VAAKPPIIRPISWTGVLAQVAFICFLAAAIAFAFGVRHLALAFLIAAVAHSVFARIMRVWLTAGFQRGVALLRASRFSDAAPVFEASHAALARRPWIDRFRFVLLGAASSMSYREMALCNAAFAYSQVGDGARAIQLYEQALREFPDSSLALSSLQMLRAGQSLASPQQT